MIKYMANRLEKSGVEVRFNTPVTKEMLEKEFKDYEVIAGCGAKANIIGAFTGFKQWMTADDILAGKAFPGRKIVIIGGGSVGCELADYLAPIINDRFVRNRDITILEMAQEVMLTETGAGRSVVVQRLMEKGVRMECLAKVTEVTENEIENNYSNNAHSYGDFTIEPFKKDGEWWGKFPLPTIAASGYREEPLVLREKLKCFGEDFTEYADLSNDPYFGLLRLRVYKY